MVRTSERHCDVCGKVTWHDDGKCNECTERREAEKQQKEDERFSKLSVEERIEDLRSRVEWLEKRY